MLNGVDTYYPQHDWAKGKAWAVKRIWGISAVQMQSALKSFHDTYKGLKYLAYHRIADMDIHTFIEEWADKDILTSMYCSKLVYQFYKSFGYDLDSNRTSYELDYYLESTSYLSESAMQDNGTINTNAFIGVSPDDIYYSRSLDSEIYSYGLSNLDL